MKKLIIVSLILIVADLAYSQQTCPKPSVYYNMRVFIDPNGVIARSIRGGEPEIQRSLNAVLTKMDTLIDKSLVNVGKNMKRIDRDEFVQLTGRNPRNPEVFINTLSIPSNAEFVFDVVVGEDVRGVSMYGFLINVKSKKIYKEISTYVSANEAKQNVIQALIKLTYNLATQYINFAGSKDHLATIIRNTEYPRSIDVVVNPRQPHIRETRFARVKIVKAVNYYGENVFDFLSNNTGFAVKLDNGKVTNAPTLSDGFYYIRSDNPEFVVELPSCDKFDITGKIDINMQFAYMCPRANVSEGVIQASLTKFTVEAPLAWDVVENWKFQGKNINLEFTNKYQLHLKANCERKIVRSIYMQGMKVAEADWISDGFVSGMSIKPAEILNVKYSDCGVLDPWTSVDKLLDTIFTVGFDNKNEGFTELGYFFQGLDMRSSINEINDLFDLIGAKIIGARVKFGDYPLYIQSLIPVDMNRLRSFKSFTYQFPFQYRFSNSACGEENVNVVVNYQFSPRVDCGCVQTAQQP
ncbi:MAG: hypothetical protein RMJ38_05440 [candidate division WOR-3 bacterium]|nr:hypothetical protein [candidate division WOR-3 bacterium]MDW8150865.1 hypothetical protein [candidate division WOR-3 bacterium]